VVGRTKPLHFARAARKRPFPFLPLLITSSRLSAAEETVFSKPTRGRALRVSLSSGVGE
jgi:hypothetical protein